MPLNFELGEPNPEIPAYFRVVEPGKWAETPFHEIACQHAAEVFFGSGSLDPQNFPIGSVLVQEYPEMQKLEFVFSKSIAGQEYFHRYVFDLSDAMIRELKVLGKWDDATEPS